MKSDVEDVQIQLEDQEKSPLKASLKKASITPSENNINRPLTKEEIEELLKDPFWRNLRRGVIGFFWVCWLVTLVLTVWIVWNAQPRKSFRESNMVGCSEIVPFLDDDTKSEANMVATNYTALLVSSRNESNFQIIIIQETSENYSYVEEATNETGNISVGIEKIKENQGCKTFTDSSQICSNDSLLLGQNVTNNELIKAVFGGYRKIFLPYVFYKQERTRLNKIMNLRRNFKGEVKKCEEEILVPCGNSQSCLKVEYVLGNEKSKVEIEFNL